MAKIETQRCAHVGKGGKVCGEHVYKGLLTGQWFHTARMFDFRDVRPPDPHGPVPDGQAMT